MYNHFTYHAELSVRSAYFCDFQVLIQQWYRCMTGTAGPRRNSHLYSVILIEKNVKRRLYFGTQHTPLTPPCARDERTEETEKKERLLMKVPVGHVSMRGDWQCAEERLNTLVLVTQFQTTGRLHSPHPPKPR